MIRKVHLTIYGDLKIGRVQMKGKAYTLSLYFVIYAVKSVTT